MPIQIVERQGPCVGDLPFEVVERKGVGHPDTICDAIAERASQVYSKYCLQTFGGIAHHWFDKVMLLGGEADIGYSRGVLIKPYQVLVAGKAAHYVGDSEIPMLDLLRLAAESVLSRVLTGFTAGAHLQVQDLTVDHQGVGRGNSRYRPKSGYDLEPLTKSGRVSNDCNVLSAFAPLSMLEEMVLSVERYLNGELFKRQNPHTGWDVKIVGRRSGTRFDLLVNMPFIAEHIDSFDAYVAAKQDVGEKIRAFVDETLSVPFTLTMNTTDRNGRPYLTALGSVADSGDVGVVGRGNRASGLITPMRPMSIEAPAGKNPIDHTGKIYTCLARNLVEALYDDLSLRSEVHIVTSKEAPLEVPDDVVIVLEPDQQTEVAEVPRIVAAQLATVSSLSEEMVFGDRPLW